MKPSRLLPVLLVVCAFAAAAVPRAQTQALSMPGYPAAGAPATVKLLAAGSEPKKQLRYAIPATHKSRLDMTTTISMAMNLGGMAVPMDMPTIKMSIDIGVTNIAANGDITYNLAFTGVDVQAGGLGERHVHQRHVDGIESGRHQVHEARHRRSDPPTTAQPDVIVS